MAVMDIYIVVSVAKDYFKGDRHYYLEETKPFSTLDKAKEYAEKKSGVKNPSYSMGVYIYQYSRGTEDRREEIWDKEMEVEDEEGGEDNADNPPD